MKLIDYMKNNNDTDFLFLMIEQYEDMHFMNNECSCLFEGYDSFVNFVLKSNDKYKDCFKEWGDCEIEPNEDLYYLGNNCIAVCAVLTEEGFGTLSNEYAKEFRHILLSLKKYVPKCPRIKK